MTKENGEVICKSSHHKILKTIVILTGLNFVILIVVAICLSWWMSQNSHSKTVYEAVSELKPISTTIFTSTTITTINSSLFHIIQRSEWDAQKPKTNLTNLHLPVNRVIIYETATKSCFHRNLCDHLVRVIQQDHMETNKWSDIGPNFLIGGDGSVYEGRGWDNQGAHTKNYNADSIGISIIGSFVVDPAPQIQFVALKLLLAEGVRLNKLAEGYKLYPHRAFNNSTNPGMPIINVIKEWPNYVDSFK